MVRKSIEELAVFDIDEEMDKLPFAFLQNLYLEKTSEIIYVTKYNKLYGIIGMREALNQTSDKEAIINKNFTSLTGYDFAKAVEIFRKNPKIHKIPIVNTQGELIGDYSCWDDLLYVKRNEQLLRNKSIVKRILESYETVYLVEPIKKQLSDFGRLAECFSNTEIKYTIINKAQILDKLSNNVICIFWDEDERRGAECLYGIEPLISDGRGYNIYKYDLLKNMEGKIRFATYKSLLVQIEEELHLERLGIEKSNNLYCDKIADKATVLLSELQNKGINCFCLYTEEFVEEITEERKNYINEVMQRIKQHPKSLKEPWPHKSENEEFYGELYQQADYENEIVQKECVGKMAHFKYRTGTRGKYFNAQNGRRATSFQPDEYVGTIYLLGMCTFIGVYVEDQYTIASLLQKILLEKGYMYKVENYGDMMRVDAAIDSRLEEIGKFKKNDILIYQSSVGVAVNIQGISIEKIFEKYRVPSTWLYDGYGHCNHKANKVIANGILEMITPCLLKQVREDSCEIQINVRDIMADYVQKKYINRYFSDFPSMEYHSIGAVVMKCNPFSRGHRYLIEQALKQVDFLILFLIEEELSMFSFEERFKMAEEGLEDLKNIKIVPSGDFILSSKNFVQFYSGVDNEAVVFNSDYDVNVFADYIAKPLNITHRFAGEELQDKIVKKYNQSMRKVLPTKGISYVEVPRARVDGEDISTKKIRSFLKNKEYNRAFSRLTNITKEYLIHQLGIIDSESTCVV